MAGTSPAGEGGYGESISPLSASGRSKRSGRNNSGYKSKLNSVRSQRKRVDNDVRLLQNRIALLKLEEQKAWKRIQATKSRAQQILVVREGNKNKLSQQAGERDHGAAGLRARVDRRYVDKELQKQKRHQDKVKEEQIKKDQVKKFKVDRKAQQQQVILMRNRELKKARERNLEARQKRAEARKKRIKLEEEKKRKAKESFDKRVAEEERARAVREKEVRRLEKLEMQYIKRLQATQAMQRESYIMLERALTGNGSNTGPRGRAAAGASEDYDDEGSVPESKSGKRRRRKKRPASGTR